MRGEKGEGKSHRYRDKRKGEQSRGKSTPGLIAFATADCSIAITTIEMTLETETEESIKPMYLLWPFSRGCLLLISN